MQSKTYIHPSGYRVFEETYTSLSEFVGQVDIFNTEIYCEMYDTNYKEVKKKTLLGDDIDFKKMQTQIDKNKLSDSELMMKTRRHDVIGSRPLVQQALNGAPNCFVRRKKQLVKQRIVNLYIDIGTSCKVYDDARTKKFTEILIFAKSLELANYRVGITLLKNHIYISPRENKPQERNISLYAIIVKKPEELINVKKLSFSLGNSLFGRTFCFANEAFKHQIPNELDENLGFSYSSFLNTGRLKDLNIYTEIVNNFIERTSGKNTNALYVSYYTDLNELKKKITQ